MAKGNNEGVVPTQELISGGHKVFYNLRTQGLHGREGTFYKHRHNTRCTALPTSWKIKLICEEMPERKDCYRFVIKLRRKDHSDVRLKVFLRSTFLNAEGLQLIRPINSTRYRMARGIELVGAVILSPEELTDVAFVAVTIQIERCHSVIGDKTSEDITDQNTMYPRPKF